jgi:hypothetical protein
VAAFPVRRFFPMVFPHVSARYNFRHQCCKDVNVFFGAENRARGVPPPFLSIFFEKEKSNSATSTRRLHGDRLVAFPVLTGENQRKTRSNARKTAPGRRDGVRVSDFAATAIFFLTVRSSLWLSRRVFFAAKAVFSAWKPCGEKDAAASIGSPPSSSGYASFSRWRRPFGAAAQHVRPQSAFRGRCRPLLDASIRTDRPRGIATARRALCRECLALVSVSLAAKAPDVRSRSRRLSDVFFVPE